MKKSSAYLFLLALIILPLYINGLFFGVHAGGDLPFFYPENLKNLIYPWAWVTAPGPHGLGFNNIGTLWLFLPLSFFGFAYHFLGADFSYTFSFALFGFLALSAFSVFQLAKFMGISYWGRLISIGVYLANSYILLIVDGGQLIFALAYAFLPFFIWLIISAFEKLKFYLIIISAIAFALLISLDMRISILGLLFVFIYGLFEINHLIKHKLFFMILGFSLVFIPVVIHAYWIFPLLVQSNSSLPFINSLGLQDLSFIKIDDALLLHQPQWPGNFFGELKPASFSFTFLSLIIFSNLIFKQTRVTLFLNILAVIVIFLAKGINPPFGEINGLLSERLPLSNLFRDPSKFVSLLALSFALLAGASFDSWRTFLGGFYKNKYSTVFLLGIFILSVTIPLSEGYTRKLNGLLGETSGQDNYRKVILDEKLNGRSLWINQKPQIAFSDDHNPALDIYALSENPFINSFNLNNYDRASFIRNPLGEDILHLLGVKFIFLDDKNIKLSDRERRENLITFLNQQEWLERKNENVYYQLSGDVNKFYALKNVFLVNGGQEIYYYLDDFSTFALKNNGFIFLDQLKKEDIANIKDVPMITTDDSYGTNYDLLAKNSDYVVKILNQGQWGKTQLSSDQWNDLLQEQYILKNNYYPQVSNVFFSTVPSEIIDIPIAKGQEQLAVQIFTNRRGGKLEFLTNEQKFVVDTYKKSDKFEWITLPQDAGDSLKIINKGGFNAIGQMLQIPKKEQDNPKNIFGINSSLSRIYLLSTKDNKVFKFEGENDYQGLVLTNEPSKLVFKKNNVIIDVKNIAKSDGWNDIGNIDFKNINEIEVTSSPSGQLIINQRYEKSIIDSNKTIRHIYKELNKKEVAEGWNSFKTQRIEVTQNSVVDLDVEVAEVISKQIQIRAHLFSGGINTFEKQVQFDSDKDMKFTIPKGFDEVQIEFLWPQRENIEELILKMSYEDTKDITLLLLPQGINLEEMFNNVTESVRWNYINPTKYQIEVTEAPAFIVSSERYNPNWSIKGPNLDNQSIQTYSLLNGFFVNNKGYYIIEYTPQRLVDKFIFLSISGFFISCLIGVILYRRNK